MGEGEEGRALNILGLCLNLAGIVLLFVFEMPFRVATGSKTVPWITSIMDVQVKTLTMSPPSSGGSGSLCLCSGRCFRYWRLHVPKASQT